MTDFTDMSVDDALRLVVSGNFTSRALGPGYEQILGRLRSDPDSFLAAFERLFLATPDPVALTELQLPHALRLLQASRPEAVRRIASQLLVLSRQVAIEQVEAFAHVEAEEGREDLRRLRKLVESRRASLVDLVQSR